ncbi:ABC transporter substrate-binding protein [Halorussus marinus]|uniref:ABC transporter substrate-binding protein n=1 Tax=Halorussus marinus TaxID=2505976 RepID=UPI00106E4D02|nr:ABC transporter substrate-binding protein [Halorussus marinus]
MVSPNDSSENRRRFLKTTGITAGAIATAGCLGTLSIGSGGSNDSGGSSESSASDTSSGETTIEWWHAMGGNLGETVDALAEDFNEQSDGVTVETSYKGSYTETLNAVTSAIGAGEAPDLAQIVDLGCRLAIDSGAFEPMEEALPSDRIDWSDFQDPVINYYSFDDTVYSLPFNSSTPIFYYNKDKFAEAGLDPESPPTTFEGIRAASETVVDQGVAEQGITFANVSWFPEQWFAEAGVPLVNEENGRADDPTEINLDTDTADRIFGWWADMYDDGLYNHAGKGAWDAAQQAFLNGKTAMWISSTAGVAAATEGAADNGFELGTAYFPTPGDTRTGVVIGGASLWMTRGLSDAKKEAVTDFLLWLAEAEQQAFWHRNTGYFPISDSAVEQLDDDGWFDDNPNFRTAFDQLKETETTTATQGWQAGPASKVRDIIQDGYISMINSDVGVDEKLGQMKTEADAALQDYIESKGS